MLIKPRVANYSTASKSYLAVSKVNIKIAKPEVPVYSSEQFCSCWKFCCRNIQRADGENLQEPVFIVGDDECYEVSVIPSESGS
jgi:hypothetical protein